MVPKEQNMTITDNCVVSIEYILTADDGEVLDSSDGEPLEYLHGADNIVEGLEKALTGKKAGDKFKIILTPEEAWGDYDDELVETLPLSMFEGVDIVEPGMEFQAESPDGEIHVMTVVEVNGEEVVVDGNHPLAGETLHYDVTVADVRVATAEEIDHGHPHGDDECCH
jgi:FKBP-type peptidyl-prolyl cis-trans isomerase SlyD